MSDSSSLQLPARSWLAKLKDDDRNVLASYGEFFPGRPGQPIITEGEDQSFLYFVVRGSLTVTRSTDKGVHVVGEIPAGESVGEMSAFDQVSLPASGTVTPNEFTQLWRISQENLHRFLDDNPVVATTMLTGLVRTLSNRIRKLNPQISATVEQFVK
ncbi:MAG: cyclic nucleotide-binding domain-containing protein [Verrucomicrobiota bacterium]